MTWHVLRCLLLLLVSLDSTSSFVSTFFPRVTLRSREAGSPIGAVASSQIGLGSVGMAFGWEGYENSDKKNSGRNGVYREHAKKTVIVPLRRGQEYICSSADCPAVCNPSEMALLRIIAYLPS